MTGDQAYETLLQAWNTGWAALHPGSGTDPADTTQAGCVPWCGRDESFTVDRLGPLQCWARVTMNHTGSGQGTQGSRGTRKYERTGIVTVQLFGTIDGGAQELLKLLEDACKVLQGATFAGVDGKLTLFAGEPRELDEPDGTPWAGTSVVFGFRYTLTG